MAKRKVIKKINTGFTLIEVMLVLVIISIIIWASVGYMQQKTLQMRIDRASIQMQQILNAALAYYVTNGKWPDPVALSTLQGSYLPPGTMKNPWGQDYLLSVYAPPASPPNNIPLPMFYVYTAVRQSGAATGSAAATANVIAGTLPLSYATADTSGSTTQPPAEGTPCTASTTTCYVVATVNIPGQELSSARAVNFAGLYKHGGCIPVPQCPTDRQGNATLTPQVMVVPVSVSGVNDEANPTNVYPISSFTAYAKGNTPLDASPPECKDGGPPATGLDCTAGPSIGPTTTAYWRACLQVITERGNVAVDRTSRWGDAVTLMAITRCAVSNEPAGSTFDVYTK